MPRNVIFAAPFPTDITMRFVRAASKLPNVRLLGIVHTPPSGADANVYQDFVRVTDPLSTKDLIDATDLLASRHGKPERIIGILEAMMVQLAQTRAHFGVPGTQPAVAELFRDKSQMKAALRAAGLPVAKSRLLRGPQDAQEFAAEVGFPMVLKPPSGMGAKSTWRVNSTEELLRGVAGIGASAERPILAEEFLRGREFSFETITLGGKQHMESLSHYLPTCLEVLETPWVQWCCMLPRDISGAEYNGARTMARGAIKALGLTDGMTHMEWFQRPDGSLVIGEIAQRPPGANISTMTGLAHGEDIFRAWVRSVVDGELDGSWERKYAVGSAFLRGMGHGRVAHVEGVHEVHQRVGKLVVEAKLPEVGAMRSDGYEGDGYIIVRHESTDMVKAALKTIIETVKVHYA
ncbi:MAG TPA: ATP-grasp domain-containing protein [Myxococcales bacterium]|jgi:biotin carboxylase|nr:ATP-grasp domain-containing protein [Myxococcales bacterium]